MSETPSDRTVLRVGEPFSPKKKFFASVIPDGLMRLRSLKEGPKLLLARLHKYAGDADKCNPSLVTLATELGTSHDTISRWMGDLERSGLIRTVRHQRREADRLMLLGPELVSSLRPPWKVLENAESPNQEPVLKTHNCVPDNAESGILKTQNDPPYKEKRIKEENQGSELPPLTPPASVAVGLVPIGRFPEWWGLWTPVMGSNHRIQAQKAYATHVTPELEDPCFTCTRSYLASRGDRNGGYNPENFLRQQAAERFEANFPPWRRPQAGSSAHEQNQQRRENVNRLAKSLSSVMP